MYTASAKMIAIVIATLLLISHLNVAMRISPPSDKNSRLERDVTPQSVMSKQRSMITRGAASVALTLTSSLLSARRSANARELDNNDCRVCQDGGDVLCRQCFIKANNKELRDIDDHTWYNPLNTRIYEPARGSFLPVSPSVIADTLRDKRVIIVAENHENPTHHKLQFEIAKTLVAGTPNSGVAIGLEPFYRQHQSSLDNFVFKHKNLARLMFETDFYKWGYSINLYSRILQFAAKNNVKLVGLNIPQPVVRLTSMVGLTKLPPELQELLPSVDLGNQKHRAMFMEAVSTDGGHMMHGYVASPEEAQRMYESQTLWDEYMAESCANFLDKNGDCKTLIVMAGVGHVKGRVGLPDRIQKRLPAGSTRPFVIVPESVDWDEQGLPVVTKLSSTDDCDWQVFTEYTINSAGDSRSA